jgi:hypothetical protein
VAVTPAKAFTVSNPADDQNVGVFDLGTNTVYDRMVGQCYFSAINGCPGAVSRFTTELPSNLRLTSASVEINSFSGVNRSAWFYSTTFTTIPSVMFGFGNTGNMMLAPENGPQSIVWESMFRQTRSADTNYELAYTWTFVTEKIAPPSSVPLPATLPLLVSALGGLAFVRRRRSAGR